LVSSACFTTHLRGTGEGGGMPHGMGDRPFFPKFALPKAGEKLVRELLDKEFGPGAAKLVGFAAGRAISSVEHHRAQLRDKPNDGAVHSNYGAFLQEVEKDLDGAERAYRRALELDPEQV